MSGAAGFADTDLVVPLVDDAILRGFREHLAVGAGLAVAALVPAVVLVAFLATLRRAEAPSLPVPGIVLEQLAVRSTRWVRRLRRLVHQLPSEEVICKATMTARMCESRAGVALQLSEVGICPPRRVVVFPLMASQQELVDRDRPLPVRVRWDARAPDVMVASIGGRVLWPRRRVRRERRAAVG